MKGLLKTIRMVTALACVALAPLWMLYASISEHFARYWVYLVAPLVGVMAMALWYVVLGPGAWRIRLKRFVIFFLLMVLTALLFVSLTRYEGSLGGSSLPRFVWRWAPQIDADIASAEPVGSAELVELAKPIGLVGLDGSLKVMGVLEQGPEDAEDSHQFLGPNRDGVWAETLASFDWEKNPPEQLWRQAIGAGWSSFAVVGRRALTQEQRQEEELVTCYDLLTGDLLWVHSDRARLESGMGGLGPRSTLTIVGGKVYAFGGTGILNCLDLKTGELIWSQDVGQRMQGHFPEWGKSTAPLLFADLVVVSGAENTAPTLLAFAAESGKEVWVYEGRGASYSSPLLLELDGDRQIVSVNGKGVCGLDPLTGQELWAFDWPGKYPKVAQPVLVGKDQILITAGYGMGSFLLKVQKKEAVWTVDERWKSKKIKTKFSSVVILGEHAYGLDGGIMACIDIKTGKRVWKGGRYGFGQQLLVGDQLLVQAEQGAVAVVKAQPSAYVETARIKALDHMTWNTPTLAGRYLLLRNDREVVCYRLAKRVR